MELLEKEGFGIMRTINQPSCKRVIFFKLAPSMLDMDLRNHINPLKMAELTPEQYESFFKDLTKVNRSILNLDPLLEEFQEELDL